MKEERGNAEDQINIPEGREQEAEYRERFLNERFDFRRFVLVSLRRWWVVLPAVLLGALLFGGIYYVKTFVIHEPRDWRVKALYSIDFDTKEAQETQLYYNDFTWNDVLDSDRIAGRAAQISGIPKEEIMAATFIPTMSDIRQIWVWTDHPEAERAAQIQAAIGEALEEFGSTTEGFRSIQCWDSEPAVLSLPEDLTVRITLFGALAGLVAGLLILAWMTAMDDGIYTEEDTEGRYGLLCAGVILSGSSKTAWQAKLREETEEELRENLAAVCEGEDTGALFFAGEPGEITVMEGAVPVIFVPWGRPLGHELYRKDKDLRLQGKKRAIVVLCGVDAGFYRAYRFGRKAGGKKHG